MELTLTIAVLVLLVAVLLLWREVQWQRSRLDTHLRSEYGAKAVSDAEEHGPVQAA